MSVSLQITNNFSRSSANSTDYFGTYYEDSQIWLYFLNSANKITYTKVSDGSVVTVSDSVAIQLSDVKASTFNLSVAEDSTKLFAALGDTNPFIGKNGPELFEKQLPYALAEWTILGKVNDNVDVSYIDSFSFPTTLKVIDANGKVTGSAGFNSGTKASDIIASFEKKIASSPVGPRNDDYPQPGAVGYGPLVSTIQGNDKAGRWLGSSKYYISGPDLNNRRSMYLYAPSFNEYLAHLQSHAPTTKTNNGDIKGWYIDYSGNNGYSGYLTVTGNATNGFGLKVHNIRVNTQPSAQNDWEAQPNVGDSTKGDIEVIANGARVPFPSNNTKAGKPKVAKTTVDGNWTDAVIYSGAAVIGTIGEGPIVTSTGNFAPGEAHYDIVATFLASISASIATGLLGSEQYVQAYSGKIHPPKSTMYWFNTLPRAKSLTTLFDKAWPGKEAYFDPFWATLSAHTGNQGYLSPFNDRWALFSPDFTLKADDTIKWYLGGE